MAEVQNSSVHDTVAMVKGLVEAVPVYQDILQPSAKAIGSGLQVVTKTVLIALAPLKALVWGYEQIEQNVLPSLAEKLKRVPKERVVTPQLTIAGPTLEALRYAGHEPSLRELYVNLLATSMDVETARKAHPAFVEIIRQLTPDEARIFTLLAQQEVAPLVTVRAERKDSSGGVDFLKHFSMLGIEAGCQCPDLTQSYLDNLNRLGLLEINPNRHLTAPGVYNALESHPQVVQLVTAISNNAETTPIIMKEMLILTALGEQFCSACVMIQN